MKAITRSWTGYRVVRQCTKKVKTFHGACTQRHASTMSNAQLNKPTDFSTTPLLHHTPAAALSNSELSKNVRNSKTQQLNLYQAVNSALRCALIADDSTIVLGQDIAFGGVFRCTKDLAGEFGGHRIFNTPLCEQGAVGFGIGAAAQGLRPIVEIQFADYVFPAFDQLVNEAAKMRYRAGSTKMACGGLVVRMPCGGVGHGALYHSQSPEALFTHVPGLRVVVPRSPFQAKGLLLSAIASNDPVIFMEPKILYRATKEEVPTDAYELPLSKAEVLKSGKSATVISYGTPLYTCSAAIAALENNHPDLSIELIDLRTVYPWDRETVLKSVNKTGKAVIVHESMVNAGVGAEVAATIQEKCFLRLEAPVQRVAGWSTHTGLAFEKFTIPDVVRVYDALKSAVMYDQT